MFKNQNHSHQPILNQESQALIQGITGKEGSKALQWMLNSGVKVVAGVTPGKGGQLLNPNTPVYNTVAEAIFHHPQISISCIYVPPQFVKQASLEAINSKIDTIHIFSENVPTQDTLTVLEKARLEQVRVLGPSSIGLVRTGVGVIGSMGGGNLSGYLKPNDNSNNKGVAIVSKSGGMANTIANYLSQHNIPQTYVIGIGGDKIIGSTYADLLEMLLEDSQTQAIVIIGEIGGSYEEAFAHKLAQLNHKLQQSNLNSSNSIILKTKPVIAFISGIFAETLPQGLAFGHAGAIVSKSEGTRNGKILALQKAGAKISNNPTEIVSILKPIIFNHKKYGILKQ
jgi:succinyl-CoA synthetase alpha subunit